MKVTWQQIERFVFDLPTNCDYESSDYGKIVIEQDYMQERITDWLKSLGIEVDE